jgi:hypothetical protein
MAHTPGPWWIDEDGDYLCICEGAVNEYGEREEVATLACNRPSLLLCQPANARLIAAAPELLAALKKCKQALKNYIDSGYDEDEDQEAYTAAMAALRKAEGRE